MRDSRSFTVNSRDDIDLLNGIEKAVFSDKTVDLRAGLDVAFVIDTTASMSGSIGAVKANAQSIIDAVFDNALNSRIAVVGYNDPGTNTFLSFTDQLTVDNRKNAAINAINSIGVSGGGDFPEVVNAGLIRALSGGAGQWRAEANARRIILFGDAPPKDTDLRSQVLSLAANTNTTLPSSTSNSVGFSVPDLSISGDIDTSYVNQNLAKTTFNVRTSNAGDYTTVTVEIFTILIGNDVTTSNDFESLASATGGKAFAAANASQVVDTLIQAIEIPAINTPPIAADDKLTIDEDASTTILATELLGNDSDINSVDTLRIIGIDNLVNGTASIVAGGNIRFTPDPEFIGICQYRYSYYRRRYSTERTHRPTAR